MTRVEKCKTLAAEMNRYFTSGNRIPVEKAFVRASEWHELYAAIDELSASLPSTVLVGLPHVGDDGFGCATLEWQRGDRRIKMHPNGVGLLKIGGQNIDEISLSDRPAVADAFEWLAASPESVEPDASPEAPAPQYTKEWCMRMAALEAQSDSEVDVGGGPAPAPQGVQATDLLNEADHACNVLAELYAKYQIKIGPFASQAQLANVRLRAAMRAAAPPSPPAVQPDPAVSPDVQELVEALRQCEFAIDDCPFVSADMTKARYIARAALSKYGSKS